MRKAGMILLSAAGAVMFIALVFNIDVKNAYLTVRNFTASVFFVDSSTEATLKETFKRAQEEGRKVRVLVVPGHDDQSWGTQFKGLKEADLTAELGEELYQLFGKEPLFDARIARTAAGYDPQLQAYLENNREAIMLFIAKQKTAMNELMSAGKLRGVINVEHNFATSEGAFKLYGINKWASENAMDVVIHIHFNDYPRRRLTRPGEYTGFSIYVPERQYSNAKGSKALAESVTRRLEIFYPQSNLPKEDVGIIEDQELIAIGANNTLDGAGMLIEYGYIYETAFTHTDSRKVILNDLALQTYLGVMDFFGIDKSRDHAFATRLVPYPWERDLEKGSAPRRDVVSLQAALLLEDLYPPRGVDKNDCGITGYFGKCTELAVQAFQKKYGISPARGFVGEQTRKKLRELYL